MVVCMTSERAFYPLMLIRRRHTGRGTSTSGPCHRCRDFEKDKARPNYLDEGLTDLGIIKAEGHT